MAKENNVSGIGLLNVIHRLREEGFDRNPIELRKGFIFMRNDGKNSAAFVRYDSTTGNGEVIYLRGDDSWRNN